MIVEICNLSEKEIKFMQEEQERRFRLYEYYGLKTGVIYDPPYGEGNIFETQEEIDKREARQLILGNKELPKDLAERLLGYKEKREK